jgi:uncharacterized protein YdhG (YjbR/CyaY superfamily)
MATSPARTVAAYLAEQPAERRAVLRKVRSVVRKHLPKGYQEGMNFGMVAWSVPLRVCADTYNGKPLCYAALAAQKHYIALYLMPLYASPVLTEKLRAGFKRAGKRLDMGKSCIRFQTTGDIPLPLIGRIVAAVPMAKWVALAQSARKGRTRRER